MNLQQVRDRLLPRQEADGRFSEYLRRLGYSGLQSLIVVEIAAPVLMQAGRMMVADTTADAGHFWQPLAAILVGLITLAASRLRWIQQHPRLAAALSICAAAAAMFAMPLWRRGDSPVADDYVIAGITLLVLTAVATVPFRPWHMLATGFAIEAMYFLSVRVAARWGIVSIPMHIEAHHIFLIMLTVLATGISASNYWHRRNEFDAGQDAVRVAEALTGAQARAQLAENAISIGKLAAALTHEINSPLGALRSSIETLTMVTDRQIAAGPDRRESLLEMRANLRRSIDESVARIQDVTKRLRRFASLEEAELKAADLNDLLTDVTVLFEEEVKAAKVQIEFDLEKQLPPLTCRPQLLTAAFSSLLSNALNAVNGDGRVSISTRKDGGEIEVTIRDNGRGMPAAEADTIFNPSFKVSDNRVSSGNWSLFNAREIVYEHGGEIRVETEQGKGTAFHVMLPVG